MEGGRGRRSSSSPEMANVSVKPRPVVIIKPTFRKVQVVYYLSRNGQLEHPHYMKVTHLADQHLRLKDVLDRLTVLRGKGMPSLYSWSCKRSYKNGYVWNDLAENDVIYPSEAERAEYVLKGSELIQGCTEKFQQLQVSNISQEVPDTTFHQKRRPLATKRHCEVEVNTSRYEVEAGDGDDKENDDEECEEKTSYTCSMTPPQHSRRSRGVSTEEAELTHKNSNATTELALDDSSPPSTPSTVSGKANENNSNTSKRFEDGDPVAFESSVSRNSVLLQLISCGGSAWFRAMKTVPVVRQQPQCIAPRKSTGSSLHRGLLCKAAAKVMKAGEEEAEAEMINYMSENPRFGNLQAEEKEYFSGSIVEAMTEERVQVESIGLKRSNSYNEERTSKAKLVETVESEAPKKEKAAVTGKCIPRMKSSSKHLKKQNPPMEKGKNVPI